MAKDKSTFGEFQALFDKNVPHILENIFSFLDYDTFKACRVVCKGWNELPSSQSYEKITKKLLGEKLANENKLCEASYKCNTEDVKHLISSGVNPNCFGTIKPYSTKATPLYFATWKGHNHEAKDVIKLLLEEGADPNKGDITTPLLLAVRNGHTDIVRLLIAGGANPNKACHEGKTPLYYSVHNGDANVVKMLLDAGADPNMTCVNGENLLYRAEKNGHKGIATLLINAVAK